MPLGPRKVTTARIAGNVLLDVRIFARSIVSAQRAGAHDLAAARAEELLELVDGEEKIDTLLDETDRFIETVWLLVQRQRRSPDWPDGPAAMPIERAA